MTVEVVEFQCYSDSKKPNNVDVNVYHKEQVEYFDYPFPLILT